MNNSISEDYFSFMSSKWEDKNAKKIPCTASTTKALLPSDTIDFVDQTQMEVTESFVSDTMIQRIFNRVTGG